MDRGALRATVHGQQRGRHDLRLLDNKETHTEGNVASSTVLHITSKITSPPSPPQVLTNLGKFQQVARVSLHQLFVANLHSH